MMSNILSSVATLGGKFMRIIPFSYRVVEQRAYVELDQSDEPHVANKRIKLAPEEDAGAPVEDDHASWHPSELVVHNLMHSKDGLLNYLRRVSNVMAITSQKDEDLRSEMNRRLKPLRFTFDKMSRLTLAFSNDGGDLCDAWTKNVASCIKVLDTIYSIHFFFSQKKKYPALHQAVDYGMDDRDREMLDMVRDFLCAPALPSVCADFLQLAAGSPDAEFPTEFANQVVVDLQAMLCAFPLPSFVEPGPFLDGLCRLFRLPARLEQDRQFHFPGSFPATKDDAKLAPQTDEKQCSEAAPKEESEQGKVLPQPASPAPVIAEAVIDPTRADYMEWRISEITARDFRQKFYHESDVHRAIEATYITDFTPKTPTKDARKPRTILKNRRKHTSRCTPKRLAMSRPPRAVRFTDDTLSPQPRTHTGLDVPRLLDHDEERATVDDPFIAVGRRPFSRLSADNTFGHRRQPGVHWPIEGAWYKPEEKHQELPSDVPVFFEYSPRRIAMLEERWARRGRLVPSGDKLREMINAPPAPGFAPEDLSDIAERLIQKKLLDVSHRNRLRAARRKAAEEAKRIADEKAKRIAEEKEAARIAAEEQARIVAEEQARIAAEAARIAAEEARIAAEEQARVAAAEAARLAAEEEKRQAEEQASREAAQRLAEEARVLRSPRHPLVALPNREWIDKAQGTLTATASRSLATTSEGSELRRHDFATVVPPTQWLNDEIINGSLMWMDKAINEAAGVHDVRRQTRKCLTLNSFFFKDLLNKGPCGTERKLRRCGVNKNNLLDVETIVLPICDRSHWTLLVVRPGHRTLMHLDSLDPRGSSTFTSLAMAWLKEVLQEKFVASEWKVVREEIPAQTNGHDCGVFAITNAMCLALGLSPVRSYAASDMATQRIRIACMLLNGGFTGDFDLGGY
ncbi:Ubiquitin-like-specific protease 1 [Ophiocordyceps camponoti-floridani]|uniref:Ubiquitin-like-specific protease 1 n=1 Tax=Ophiocordyceps camponoti-floridani TaxID=2030778 RepID=A0A8H4Q6I7_9HYPO|nr:Ubiquitin-like-specific protease 1 [Ophiocordyceps camponoti-floridani]